MRALLNSAEQEMTLAQALETLALKYTEAFSLSNANQVVRLTLRIKPLNSITWLKNQTDPFRFFWSGRDNLLTYVAIGCVHDLKAPTRDHLASLLETVDESLARCKDDRRYIGGVCFDPAHCPIDSDGFGMARFILPFLEINEKEDGTFLACNIPPYFSPGELRDRLAKVNFSSDPILGDRDFDPRKSAQRIDVPTREEFCRIVQGALRTIAEKHLEKIVLARQTTFSGLKFDPYRVLAEWKAHETEVNCFSLEMGQKAVFLGASPERLFYRKGRDVLTEALAGTVEHTGNISEKEQLEHRYVVEMIDATLKNFCAKVTFPARPQLRDSKGGRHLLTPFHGVLKPAVTDRDLFLALHPTPAVAGTPTDKARSAIRALEPFSRRWYAGAVGFFSNETTELAVAIRSGYWRENQLTLFSGAGIVPGSKPGEEWDETERKLRTFTV